MMRYRLSAPLRALAAVAAFVAAVAPTHAMAQSEIDAAIAGLIGPVGSVLAEYVFVSVEVAGVEIELIVLWLLLPMLFLTVYFRFINLRGFKIAWRVARGRYQDNSAPGEVTQFQALSTALSGTVGIGNIAGVAIAIAMGGPGATFWMILIGLAAMSLKFAECTLAVKYREQHADGTVSGGPMHYLKRGLAARGYPRLGLLLAIFYAIVGIPTLMQILTVNQVYSQVSSTWPIFSSGWVFGVILAVVVGAVIIGGIKSIARVTSLLVPFMVAIYLLTAITIILMHLTEIPHALAIIFEGAFNPESVAGGMIGVIVVGMRRAVYSTEAGLGTSSIAHSAAKTREPVSEGMVGLMEPFIDTVVVSTMTALVIVITGAYELRSQGFSDVQITSAAFTEVIPWFNHMIALAMVLFGVSTIISWGYYTGKIWTFVFGETKISEGTFKTLFLFFLIPGAIMGTDEVVDLMDSLFFLMAFPNILGIYIMAPEIRADLKSYLRRLKSGEIPETTAVAAAQPAE